MHNVCMAIRQLDMNMSMDTFCLSTFQVWHVGYQMKAYEKVYSNNILDHHFKFICSCINQLTMIASFWYTS